MSMIVCYRGSRQVKIDLDRVPAPKVSQDSIKQKNAVNAASSSADHLCLQPHKLQQPTVLFAFGAHVMYCTNLFVILRRCHLMSHYAKTCLPRHCFLRVGQSQRRKSVFPVNILIKLLLTVHHCNSRMQSPV